MSHVLVVDFPTFLIVVLAVVLIYRFVSPRLFGRRAPSSSSSSPSIVEGSALPASVSVPDSPVVGSVSQLWLFPVKSCPGVSVQRAVLGPRGLVHDRQLMLVRDISDKNTSNDDEEPSVSGFVSLRTVPALARLSVSFDGSSVLVSHPIAGELRIEPEEGEATGEVLRCRIWDDEVLCRTVSKEADRFFSAAAGTALRLVRLGRDFEREVPPEVRDGVARSDTSLADGFPYLLTSTSSLAAVSKHLGETVDMRRFRGNIVMKTDLPPFEEDIIAELKIGEHAVFRNLKCCSRCKVPRLSLEEGTEDSRGQPTKALIELNHNFKEDAYFGVNLGHAIGMEVRENTFFLSLFSFSFFFFPFKGI